MSDDRKPEPESQETLPGEATPRNPGVGQNSGDPTGESKPAEGAPYDKKRDPAQQPS